MLTLQCLWCRHRNPAGEDVCNACGTPLYLKPCTHCDAANQRAAAHCRNCGEAFSFDFVAAAELERDLGDAIVTAGDTAPAETSRHARLVRASALAVVVAALPAYFAYRQSAAPSSPTSALEPAEASTSLPALLPAILVLPELSPLPDDQLSKFRDERRRAVARRGVAPARAKGASAKPRKVASVIVAGGPTFVAAADAKPSVSCTEGGMLSPSCDVRTLAKGN